jgi:putative alpha-1,2-mannosidase
VTSALSGLHLRPGIELPAFTPGVFFTIETVTDEAAGSSIGDAIPDGGVGWWMIGFSGPATMDDDLVASFHNENVFHGVTAANSGSHQL